MDEELLHANTSITPPHQYLGFYHWGRDRFKADTLVHAGRHSTYELLPGKAVGLSSDGYPSLIGSAVQCSHCGAAFSVVITNNVFSVEANVSHQTI